MLRTAATPGSVGFAGARTPRSEALTENAPAPTRFLDRFLFIAYVLATVWSANSNGSAADADGGQSGLSTLAYLAAFGAVLIERKAAVRIIRNALPLVMVLLVPFLSAFFSDEPAFAVQRSLGLLGYTLIALALVCRLGLKGFLETIALLTVIEAALSAVLILLFPAIGLGEMGEWRGLMFTKNELGQSMVLGMLTILCLGNSSSGRQRFRFFAFLLLCVLAIGSRNVGSLVIAAILLISAIIAFWCRVHCRKPLLLGTAVVGTSVLFAIVGTAVGVDQLFGVLGKDATLTGRTELWQAIIEAIRDRPLFGYGDGLFWSDDGPSANIMLQHEIVWDPGMAHNGLLEVAVNVGLVAVAVLLVLIVVGLRRAAAVFWRSRSRVSAWPILIMMYVILSNISEASFLRSHNLLWLVYVASFLFAIDLCQPQRKPASEDMRTVV